MKQATIGGLGGLVAGAGLMYLWDPAWGRRRRSLVRDKAVRGAHKIQEATARTTADLKHRTRGLGARLRHLTDRRPPDDRVLEQRVRTRLGRVCSHPHAIDVFALDGAVELSGPILASEVPHVLREAECARGVREVKNLLEVHQHPDNLPSLQGAGRVSPGRRSWPPALRLLTGATGASLMIAGLGRQSALSYGGGLLGLGLLLRSLSNQPLRHLVSLSDERSGIKLDKTIQVNAPVAEVFALWSNFEAFPRFLSHVKEVRRTDEGTYRWEVTGPAGTSVSWLANVTRYVPNRTIAWSSLPGSPVVTEGEVRFRPTISGTRLEIQLAYRPPAGAIGHALATLLGANPRRQITEDLIRVKSLLEDGRATGRQETVDREEIVPGFVRGQGFEP